MKQNPLNTRIRTRNFNVLDNDILNEETRTFLKRYARERGMFATNLVHAVKVALEDGSVYMDGNVFRSDKPVYMKDGKIIRNKPTKLEVNTENIDDMTYLKIVSHMNNITIPQILLAVESALRNGSAGIINGRFCVIKRIIETEKGTVIR